MKKSIIVTVIISTAILGVLIGAGFLSRFVVNQSSNKASQVARNASIRSTVSTIVPYIEIWGFENKNHFTGFIENPSNLEKIKPYFDDLEKGLHVKIRYSILSTDTHYVVRLGVQGEDLFYCADSTGPGASEHHESSTDQFTARTNCEGKPL